MRSDQFDPFEPILAPVFVVGLGSSVVKVISHYSAESFNLDVSDIVGRSKVREIALARQVSYYVAKCTTKWTTTEIGRRFGMRDHSTILHGMKKVDRLCEEHPEFRERVEGIRRKVTLAFQYRSSITVPGERQRHVSEQQGEGAGTLPVA